MSVAMRAIAHPSELFSPLLFGVGIAEDAGDDQACLVQAYADEADSGIARKAGRLTMPGLHTDEFALVAGSIEKRQRQFAAGRHCARRAIGALYPHSVSLLRDDHGAPIWPAAMIGSISHTDGMTIGVAARRAQVVGVGVDVESRRQPFPLEVLPRICLEAECAQIAGLPEGERGLYAAAYFSIKETIYKCVYTETGERWGFHDACVRFDWARGVFIARLVRALPGGAREIDGRIGCNDDFVFSCAWRMAGGVGTRPEMVVSGRCWPS